MNLKRSLLPLLLGVAAGQALACYTVYDRSGRVLYNEETPPVDMSRPIHETLPARFPAAHLVFDAQAGCDSIAPLSLLTASPGVAPLLTEPRTARAMNVSYTVLAGGIALIRPGDARTRPGVTVIPAAALAGAPAARGMVITELRDPPMTIVQSGDRTEINELSVMGNAATPSSIRPSR
jgi:hypothetical protein